MTAFLLWMLLFLICWPLALLALILYPVIWLLLLPFRLVGIVFEGLFGFLRGLLLLPPESCADGNRNSARERPLTAAGITHRVSVPAGDSSLRKYTPGGTGEPVSPRPSHTISCSPGDMTPS